MDEPPPPPPKKKKKTPTTSVFDNSEKLVNNQGRIQDSHWGGGGGAKDSVGANTLRARSPRSLTAGVLGYYLETDPDPVAMVIRVELVIHKPTETNANEHCMVTHAGLC